MADYSRFSIPSTHTHIYIYKYIYIYIKEKCNLRVKPCRPRSFCTRQRAPSHGQRCVTKTSSETGSYRRAPVIFLLDISRFSIPSSTQTSDLQTWKFELGKLGLRLECDTNFRGREEAPAIEPSLSSVLRTQMRQWHSSPDYPVTSARTTPLKTTGRRHNITI